MVKILSVKMEGPVSLNLTTSVTFSVPALLDTVEETANTEHMEVYTHRSMTCIIIVFALPFVPYSAS